MGERDHFISMEMAAIGMEMMAEWGADAVCERLAMLTCRIEEGLRGSGVRMPDRRRRAPHILSLDLDEGLASGLVDGLAAEGIYVAPRLGRMRISPHVFNDEEDADRLVSALARRLEPVRF
jgi:selenocysteine lyase/cysteine desulfurase